MSHIQHTHKHTSYVVQFDVEHKQLFNQMEALINKLGLVNNIDIIDIWFDSELVRECLSEEVTPLPDAVNDILKEFEILKNSISLRYF